MICMRRKWGNIAHYQNGVWTKIESGTTTNVANIYGCYTNSGFEVLCLVSNAYSTDETKLLSINSNNTITQLSATGLQWGMNDLWFKGNKKYYVVGNGIHTKHDIKSTIEIWKKIVVRPPANYFTCSIDGLGLNDIIISGASAEVVHYNGFSWKNFRQELGILYGMLESCKIYKNTVVVAGYDGTNAIIIVGKRN